MTVFWMPAALSSDLPAGTAMPIATLFGMLALWRSGSGRVAAFADRCPHRGMRLSQGFVRGEALSCIYQGWSYAGGGNCLRIPAHPALEPPASIRVETHEVEETDGIVWVAPARPAGGPPRLASLVPIRSLTANAPPAVIEAAAGATADGAGLVRIDGAEPPFALLLAHQPEERTLIHVLAPETAGPSGRLAASRAAEALRRCVESSGQGKAA